MAHSQIGDTEKGLQIWMITANVLNKQPLTAKKGWTSSIEV
jgi:hypothetical protein